MTDECTSPLPRRMLDDDDPPLRREDLKRLHSPRQDLRGLSRPVSDTASAEDLRLFQLHQRQNHAGTSTVNSAVSALLDGEGMSELCPEFGISRKTGYKIFNRYRQDGVEALTDRSRQPVRYANQLRH